MPVSVTVEQVSTLETDAHKAQQTTQAAILQQQSLRAQLEQAQRELATSQRETRYLQLLHVGMMIHDGHSTDTS